MALWKLFKGNRSNLNAVEKHDGYVYFCDDGSLHFDYIGSDGVLKRKQVNEFSSKSTSISLKASNWTGSADPYSQRVNIENITNNSKIDLNPTLDQLNELLVCGIALQAINENGIVTVYAMGGKPASDYNIQVGITETEVI